MRHLKKTEKYREPHRHDKLIMFLCFLTSAIVGYVLTNHVALLGN